ncbi:uncharacterized protein PAC_06078 [Phialocephala subalpina]|uniref:Mitochondrial division protein 1 n=1 Tax=Phialocephala subalpina TaxID=576137 RepID=A0A1L7WTW8_9HELO|nr:uncharacterized protein PAC_06078 [Phialocephala subalpina]
METKRKLEGHTNSVYSAAFLPDSKQVVPGSYDNTVRLWDAVTGKLLQTLEGSSSSASSVAFSLDGKQVVSGSYDNTVRLWDTVTRKLLQILEGYTGSVNSAVFLLNSRQVNTLLVSNDWVVEGGTKILWLPPEYRRPSHVAVWNQSLILGYHPIPRFMEQAQVVVTIYENRTFSEVWSTTPEWQKQNPKDTEWNSSSSITWHMHPTASMPYATQSQTHNPSSQGWHIPNQPFQI